MSFNKVGDVQVAQGDLAGALKSYNDSLAIFDQLAKSDPGNARWQYDVAMLYAQLADAFKQSGESEEALDALGQGRAITSRLTEMSPENAQWKNDLDWFERQIAQLSPGDRSSPSSDHPST